MAMSLQVQLRSALRRVRHGTALHGFVHPNTRKRNWCDNRQAQGQQGQQGQCGPHGPQAPHGHRSAPQAGPPQCLQRHSAHAHRQAQGRQAPHGPQAPHGRRSAPQAGPPHRFQRHSAHAHAHGAHKPYRLVHLDGFVCRHRFITGIAEKGPQWHTPPDQPRASPPQCWRAPLQASLPTCRQPPLQATLPIRWRARANARHPAFPVVHPPREGRYSAPDG